MIRRLRAHHRSISVALALFAPTLLVAALLARPDAPRMAEPTPPILPTDPPRTLPIDDVLVRYWTTPTTTTRELLLQATASLEHPDVLIYAVFEPVPRNGALPTNSVFLAPLTGTVPLLTPLDTAPDATHFLLFSLPHQEVLGSAPL